LLSPGALYPPGSVLLRRYGDTNVVKLWVNSAP